MIRTGVAKLTSLAMFGVVLLIGIGAALGGNLPPGIQDAVSEAAASVGVDLPSSDSRDAIFAPTAFKLDESDVASAPVEDTSRPDAEPSDRAKEVHDAIDQHKADLDAWTTCVATAASQRGRAQDDDPADAPDRGFDPTNECGEKPHLETPDPASPKATGKPDAPESPNPAKPDDVGRPETPGKPDDPGNSSTNGKANRP